MMGKDKRRWRKLVKKLRRKKKRQENAKPESPDICEHCRLYIELEHCTDDSSDCSDSEKDEVDTDNDVLLDKRFFLSQEEWESREKQADLAAIFKQIESDRLAEIEIENQRKIREEWEAKQEHERKLREEKARVEKQLKEKQEEEFNEFLRFLSGDIETPPTKYLLPDTISDDENICYYFSKTAACKFYDRCTKSHPRPTLSTAILIPNFFSHFKLEQSTRDEYDSDLGLEYEDQELHNEFMEFYEDVVPELRKYGTLIQFKVCCNLEPHLRGNVYIQYRTIQEAVQAYRVFNGRFYNGRQLSLQFIKMDSWRSAICGSFLRKACVKGRTCNYLHVFRNPTKEFVKADHDWKEPPSQRGIAATKPTQEPFTKRRNTQQDLTFSTPKSNETESSQNKLPIEIVPNSKRLSQHHVSLIEKQSHSPSKRSHSERSQSSSSVSSKRTKKEKKVKKKSKKSKKHKRTKHKKKDYKNRDKLN